MNETGSTTYADIQRRIADRLERLKKSRTTRRTLRQDLASRRDDLLALRDQGLSIVEIATTYQDILQDLGWPRPSLSYLIKLTSDITKNAFPRRRRPAGPDAGAHVPARHTPDDGLIPVSRAVIGGIEMDTVDARELHAFLDVGKRFATWITDRIVQYGFVENQDFVIDFPNLGNQSGRGGDRRSKEYILTLGMAKELAMVERTAKGQEARRYFIEIERRYYAGERPDTLSVPSTGTDRPSLEDWLQTDAPSRDRSAAEPAITFLDALLPLSLPKFLAMAQGIYDVLKETRPATDDPAALPREAIQEAARIAGVHLPVLTECFGERKRGGWLRR